MNKRYSLLVVGNVNSDSTVDGNWLKNCAGCSMTEAIERARSTEKANGYRISVAVVDALDFGVTDYNYKKGLVRYDIKQNNKNLTQQRD